MNKRIIKQKILVVDDDPDMRMFLSTLLKTGGFKPIIAKNGLEGIQKVKTENPVFIIMDVPMPDNGGMLMYRHLKLDKQLKRIPVIMVSTIDKKTFTHYQKTKGIRLGQDIADPEGFFEKPPEASEVLSLIRETLQTGFDQHE